MFPALPLCVCKLTGVCLVCVAIAVLTGYCGHRVCDYAMIIRKREVKRAVCKLTLFCYPFLEIRRVFISAASLSVRHGHGWPILTAREVEPALPW